MNDDEEMFVVHGILVLIVLGAEQHLRVENTIQLQIVAVGDQFVARRQPFQFRLGRARRAVAGERENLGQCVVVHRSIQC